MAMTTSKLNRRRFLTTIGVGGAAVAAAAVTRQGSEAKKQKPAATQQGKGYQLTEHVRRYYETTKV
jgi:DMSO/TMAO reductase YedYZ molybdopterin-dependent catalytic subunit